MNRIHRQFIENENKLLLKAATFLGGVFFIAVYSNWPIYNFVINGGVPPVYYYIIIILTAGILVIMNPFSFYSMYGEPLLKWFLVYSISGLIWIILGEGSIDPENQSWRLRFLMYMLFFSAFIIIYFADLYILSIVLFVTAVFISATYWHDFISPFFYVPQNFILSNPGRAAGLYINANQAGNALVLIGITAMPIISPKLRIYLIGAVIFGVVPTFSRSSIIMSIVALFFWVKFGYIKGYQMVYACIIGVLLFIVGGIFFEYGLSSGDLNSSNVTNRLGFFTGESGAQDDSANERLFVANLAWDIFLKNPFFGIGVGATRMGGGGDWGFFQSTHNIYLLNMVEQGIFGLLVYMCFLWLIFVKGYSLIRYSIGESGRNIGYSIILLAAYYLFIGLFSHTLLEESIGFMSLAFLIIAGKKVAYK